MAILTILLQSCGFKLNFLSYEPANTSSFLICKAQNYETCYYLESKIKSDLNQDIDGILEVNIIESNTYSNWSTTGVARIANKSIEIQYTFVSRNTPITTSESLIFNTSYEFSNNLITDQAANQNANERAIDNLLYKIKHILITLPKSSSSS